MRSAVPLLVLLVSSAVSAQTKREVPVGLILSPAGALTIRAGSETPLAAKAAEVVFAGDVLRTGAQPATFLFCPGKAVFSLAASGDVLFQAAGLKVRTGKTSEVRKAESCLLPSVLHVATASQQHYGVSMVRGLPSAGESKPVVAANLDAAVQAELVPFPAPASGAPIDPAAALGRATVFEKHNLLPNALEEYQRLAKAQPGAEWVNGKIFELQEAIAVAAASKTPEVDGTAYALLIGISNYQKLPKELWLRYATADALTLQKHFLSPRGGALKPENVVTLVDEGATTASIRNALQTFIKRRAGKKDSVTIAIAAHGTVETPGNKGAFILTYDSDPQDLGATALPMVEIQELINTELAKVGRLSLFVDVCRAGTIGSIKSTSVNAAVERLGEADGEILAMMASRPKELSHEGEQFGGGHGVFTYYLLKGLAGAADKNSDQVVDANEMIEYVRKEVAQATEDKQHPRDFGNVANTVTLSDLKKPGITIASIDRRPWRVLTDAAGRPLEFASAEAPFQEQTSRDAERFEDDLRAGRILPEQPNGAFARLAALKGQIGAEEYRAKEDQLRVALENSGQQVLLRYLQGDQIPQNKADFASGAQYFEAALTLTPESIYLRARALFCRGRAVLFDKAFRDSAGLLENSIRMDPAGAYSYNALGIAYLEQADYDRAVPAFHDAIRRAPLWSYPLQNLALALTEKGDYSRAIAMYRKAISLNPQGGYLCYNLGLLYQRLNRRRDAEAMYKLAQERSPDLADVDNAFGSLYASNGKFDQAERSYRQALQKNPALYAARHNLALLLSQRPDRVDEAVRLWRENLAASPTYVASRLSLAETAAQRGDTRQAIEDYRGVLAQRPEYVAARIALVGLLQKSGDLDAALAEGRTLLAAAPANPGVLEQVGDLQKARGNSDEARKLYEQAVSATSDGAVKKRLKRKAGAL